MSFVDLYKYLSLKPKHLRIIEELIGFRGDLRIYIGSKLRF